MNKSNTSCSQ